MPAVKKIVENKIIFDDDTTLKLSYDNISKLMRWYIEQSDKMMAVLNA